MFHWSMLRNLIWNSGDLIWVERGEVNSNDLYSLGLVGNADCSGRMNEAQRQRVGPTRSHNWLLVSRSRRRGMNVVPVQQWKHRMSNFNR